MATLDLLLHGERLRRWPAGHPLRRRLEGAEGGASRDGVGAVLARLAGAAAPWPLAPLLALGEGLAEGAWQRLDPVRLVPNREHVVLLGQTELALTEAEAAQLSETLAAWDLVPGLRQPHPLRWYRPWKEAGPQLPPWPEVLGGNVRQYWPEGPEARPWRAWMAELEMALHQSPVNARRRLEGRPTVDGLWPWGGGRLPPPPAVPWRWIAGEGPLARGLARWLGRPQVTWSADLEGPGLWLMDADPVAASEAGPEPDWAVLLRRPLRVALVGQGLWTLRPAPWWAWWRR